MSASPISPSSMREPPKNLNAERAVIGAGLIDNATINVSMDLISGKMLYPTAHQEIWAAMLGLHKDNITVDLVSVAEYLERNGKLKSCGGAAYLAEFEQYVLTTQNPEYYCELVKDAWTRRATINAAYETIEDAYRQDITALDVAGEMMQRASALALAQDRSGLVHIADALYDEMGALEARSCGNVDPNPPIATGIFPLDEIIGGLRLGNLVYLGARTNIGKTALGCTIVNNAAKCGYGVAIFSLEMRANVLIRRLVAQRASGGRDVTADSLRDGIKSRQALLRAVDIGEQLVKENIFVDDKCSGLTPSVLKSRIQRQRAQQDCLQVVMVDYFQRLRGDGQYKGTTEELGDISHRLKDIAEECDVCMLVPAQLNREPEKRGKGSRPQIYDIRWCGDAEQDADVIVLVHRPDKNRARATYGEPAELIVGKQRDGSTGSTSSDNGNIHKVEFIDELTLFRSCN